MIAQKSKKSALAGIALVLIVAGIAIAWHVPRQPVFELLPVSVSPAVGYDSLIRFWTEKRTLNSAELLRLNVFRMKLKMPVGEDQSFMIVQEGLEAKSGDLRMKMPDAVLVWEEKEDASGPRVVTRTVYFLAPWETEGCRVKLRYQACSSGGIFGIGTPWPRYGLGGTRIERMVKSLDALAPRFSHWLWPADFPIKTATVEMSFTNKSAGAVARLTPKN